MNDPTDVENVCTQAPASTPPAQEAVPEVPVVAPEVQHAVSLATAQLVATPQALVS